MIEKAYPTIQEAIYHTTHGGGVDMKVIAAELDYGPSNLSQRTSISENPVAPFPASKLIALQQITKNHSILLTMADALGFEIRPKQERLPEILTRIQEKQRELHEEFKRMEQLTFSLPGMVQTKGKR